MPMLSIISISELEQCNVIRVVLTGLMAKNPQRYFRTCPYIMESSRGEGGEGCYLRLFMTVQVGGKRSHWLFPVDATERVKFVNKIVREE